MARKLIKVTLYLEADDDPTASSKLLEKILMRPAFAPGDEPVPEVNIPAIGDFVYITECGEEKHFADVAGVHVEVSEED